MYPHATPNLPASVLFVHRCLDASSSFESCPRNAIVNLHEAMWYYKDNDITLLITVTVAFSAYRVHLLQGKSENFMFFSAQDDSKDLPGKVSDELPPLFWNLSLVTRVITGRRQRWKVGIPRATVLEKPRAALFYLTSSYTDFCSRARHELMLKNQEKNKNTEDV